MIKNKIVEKKMLYEQEGSEAEAGRGTSIELRTDVGGRVTVFISEAPVPRAWALRVHLRPGSLLSTVGGGPVRHLHPTKECGDAGFFPFGGLGSTPACGAGAIAEVRLPKTSKAQRFDASVSIGLHE